MHPKMHPIVLVTFLSTTEIVAMWQKRRQKVGIEMNKDQLVKLCRYIDCIVYFVSQSCLSRL